MKTLTFGFTLFLIKLFSGLYGSLQIQQIIPFPDAIRALCTAALAFWLARLLALSLLAKLSVPALQSGRRMLQAGIALYVILSGPFLTAGQIPFLRDLLTSPPNLMQGLSLLQAWLTTLAEYLLCAGLILPFAGLQPVPPPAQPAQRRLNRLLAGLGMTLLLWSAFGASEALLRWRLSPHALPDLAVMRHAWLANGAIVLAAVCLFLTRTPVGRSIGHSLPARDLLLAGIVLVMADIAVQFLPALLPVHPWMIAPLRTAHLLCDNVARLLLLFGVGRMILAASHRAPAADGHA